MQEILNKLKAEFPRSAISWRAQSVTKKEPFKALALAYIDARDVQNRLDDVLGSDWQCRYSHADKKTICEIGIKVDGEWIWRANGAGDTDIEAEKGAISDAFKRAAVMWGIGRYLYDMEAVWVPCKTYKANKNGREVDVFSEWLGDPWNFVKGTKKPEQEVKSVFDSAEAREKWEKNAIRAFNEAKTLTDLQKTYVDFYKEKHVAAKDKENPNQEDRRVAGRVTVALNACKTTLEAYVPPLNDAIQTGAQDG